MPTFERRLMITLHVFKQSSKRSYLGMKSLNFAPEVWMESTGKPYLNRHATFAHLLNLYTMEYDSLNSLYLSKRP